MLPIIALGGIAAGGFIGSLISVRPFRKRKLDDKVLIRTCGTAYVNGFNHGFDLPTFNDVFQEMRDEAIAESNRANCIPLSCRTGTENAMRADFQATHTNNVISVRMSEGGHDLYLVFRKKGAIFEDVLRMCGMATAQSGINFSEEMVAILSTTLAEFSVPFRHKPH